MKSAYNNEMFSKYEKESDEKNVLIAEHSLPRIGMADSDPIKKSYYRFRYDLKNDQVGSESEKR